MVTHSSLVIRRDDDDFETTIQGLSQLVVLGAFAIAAGER